MTRQGTIRATREQGGTVLLELRLTSAEFLDLLTGLMWVDILGGFSAWRTMPPSHIAGMFTLRRTYAAPYGTAAATERTAPADESRATSPAAESDGRAAAATGDGSDEAGSRDLRPEHYHATDLAVPGGRLDQTVPGVPESANKARILRRRGP